MLTSFFQLESFMWSSSVSCLCDVVIALVLPDTFSIGAQRVSNISPSTLPAPGMYVGANIGMHSSLWPWTWNRPIPLCITRSGSRCRYGWTLVDSVLEVLPVLTHDIIQYYHQRNTTKPLQRLTEDIIHVHLSYQARSIIWARNVFNETTDLSPFWKLTTLWGMKNPCLAQDAAPMPVYNRLSSWLELVLLHARCSLHVHFSKHQNQ